jgi:hypothetical protein
VALIFNGLGVKRYYYAFEINACGSKHENFASAFLANSLQHTWFVEAVFSLVSP